MDNRGSMKKNIDIRGALREQARVEASMWRTVVVLLLFAAVAMAWMWCSR